MGQRYSIYVINLDDATVKGTNNVEDVEKLVSEPCDTIVMMPQSGVYFMGSREEKQIEPLETDNDEDEDEDEDNDR